MLVVWIELVELRPFSSEDHNLLKVLGGRLSQGLHRVYQLDEQRETALALQHAMLGPATLPGASRSGITRPAIRSRLAVTGTTSSISTTGASR